jgi:hypothetical protein
MINIGCCSVWKCEKLMHLKGKEKRKIKSDWIDQLVKWSFPVQM